ncbi:histidine kinase [Mycobacterium asiaticum]|uniref:Histidine kinase n=2 Tax=Mycobacterium asiaticum TaxID=1790 RepID=A0A1A3CL17_MYCAS|nr:CBS domain-containing protein [Mycobacterium asiaticum]OBI87067.1 histidine kinase [Mycobacterium asiaticum]
MRIADVLRNKGAAVTTINPDATVRELLAGLAEQNIGAMVVVGDEGVVGIVSERDVVRQLHVHGASVLSRPVAKIMTNAVTTCTKSDTVDSVSVLMTQNRVRHVPVLDVPEEGIRREGAILDRETFDVVAARLRAEYSWR